MPKLGMEPIRRRQMIDATKACILEEGPSRASLQRIARRIGVTQGLISHYFGERDALFEEVFRDIYRDVARETARRLSRARTPSGRLLAVLDAQISDATLSPEAVATWFAICVKIPHSAVLMRLERIYDRRLASNLAHALKLMGRSPKDAREIAEELVILIDGVWLNLANPVSLPRSRARRILVRNLKARVPELAVSESVSMGAAT